MCPGFSGRFFVERPALTMENFPIALETNRCGMAKGTILLFS